MKFIQNIKKNIFWSKPIYYICVVFVTMILFSGCENFVDVDAPDSQLTGETVFENANTAKASLLHIYSRLRDNVLVTGNNYGITLLLGFYADELTYYSTANLPDQNFYQNNLLASNTTILSTWTDSYNLIYSANSILEGLVKSPNISDVDKKQLQGEALFIRAYIHFYLLNLYGSIPYVTTTDYRINTTITKMSPDILYPLLIEDLKQAETLLSDSYVGADRVRPNRSVVQALLSRIYLYTGDWQSAEMEANTIIANTTLYSWVDNLDNVFLKNSTGTLWQLMAGSSGLNTIEAQSFIFTSGPPPERSLTDELVSAFEPGDERKTHWIGSVSNDTDTWYFANKYKENSSTSSSVEYSILFRLEELYLIRAEALAQQGNLNGAKEDLNKIRNRAGLGDIITNNKEEILQAILKERRVEFFTELGHRWFDLKRTGQLNNALSYKPGWDANDTLWPLPETELLLNPNLAPQNTGY